MKKIEDPDDLTTEDRTLITEVFDSLEIVHSELASACSALSSLSRSLKPKQLMMVLKASTRPLIQIKPASVLLEPDTTGSNHDLPDDPEERVEKLMVPDPELRLLQEERINSPTRLLVATWSFRVLNIYSRGTTQKENTRPVQCESKTAGSLYHQKKVPRGHGQKKKTARPR